MQAVKIKTVLNESGTRVFKAKTAPPTTGQLGRSGQSGVPKVPKRPVTVATSPCLGPHRRHSAILSGKENQKQARRVSTGMLKTLSEHRPSKKDSPISVSNIMTSSSILNFITALVGSYLSIPSLLLLQACRSPSLIFASSPVLLGLNFLSTNSACGQEQVSPPVTTPTNAQIRAFEPQSTIRAKKRAEFESRRAVNAQKRTADDIVQNEQRVKEMNKELDVLRELI
jgi:hypothetical protein